MARESACSNSRPISKIDTTRKCNYTGVNSCYSEDAQNAQEMVKIAAHC